MKNTPILIPSFEPDDRLLKLVGDLVLQDYYVLIVDDGSGDRFQDIFFKTEEKLGKNGTVIHHEYNKGKGRALKTGFDNICEICPWAIGVITADSDGQHNVDSINKIFYELNKKKNAMILGVRTFDKENIPWKSWIGNRVTSTIFKLLTGYSIYDTQTGLRGIPSDLIGEILDIEGERFEYEMNMIVDLISKCEIVQVEIDTIYDSKTKHKTHFNAYKDSVKIYKCLLKKIGVLRRNREML